MDESKMPNGSVFDDDLRMSFDNADLVAVGMRIERQLLSLTLTMAFGIGVLVYIAGKR